MAELELICAAAVKSIHYIWPMALVLGIGLAVERARF